MTLNELVKITTLRTTGPKKANQKSQNLSTLSDMAEFLPNVSIHQTQTVDFTDVIWYYCILLNFLLISIFVFLIERKAMIRNRYNYPTPPIRDIKGKETQTRNKWTLMETSLAESQTDSYFPTKWSNGYPKQKRCKRHTHSKTNYNKNKPLQKNCLRTVSEKYFTGGWGRGGGRGAGLGLIQSA